ncbi:hypothetical protein RUND412_006970 [Rhizina undulata]
MGTVSDVAFFDNVKKCIGDEVDNNKFRALFHGFLRDSMSSKELIEKASTFIGKSQELMKELKEFMGINNSFECKEENTSKLPQGINFNYTHCTKVGPSYRLLDKSGSHPEWAAKGWGFKGTVKNTSNLTMFRLENEQHQITLGLETNRSAIWVFTQLEQEISAMEPEEKTKFRITSDFSGDTKSVYQRALRTIYGDEEGIEIIQLLQSYPAIIAPIILKQLKDKDLEWNEAFMGWKISWREQAAMVYEKSLDYRVTEIKEADSKLFTVKSLLEQFNHIKKTANKSNKKSTTSASDREPTLEYNLSDYDVILDAIQLLIIVFQNAGFSSNDCERIAGFIEAFIPLFFGINLNDLENVINTIRRKSQSVRNNSYRPPNSGALSHHLLRDVLRRANNEPGVWTSRPIKLHPQIGKLRKNESQANSL